jgi:hypothetical protein
VTDYLHADLKIAGLQNSVKRFWAAFLGCLNVKIIPLSGGLLGPLKVKVTCHSTHLEERPSDCRYDLH